MPAGQVPASPATRAACILWLRCAHTRTVTCLVLRRIDIRNYRCFRSFTLDFNARVNIVVGANDSGKSTLLEAINLALSGRVRGRPLAAELSPHMFNQAAVANYLEELRTGKRPIPPEISIDLYLDETDETAPLKGTNNAAHEDACGLRVSVRFDRDFAEEYQNFIADPQAVTMVPAEYCAVAWRSFADAAVTARSIPISASMIDASAIQLKSGTDYYLQHLVRQHLAPAERVEVARAYRSLREEFSEEAAIAAVNQRLRETDDQILGPDFTLAIDISHSASWESDLVPHLHDLPFRFVGKGQQSTLKILLALHRKLQGSHAVLVEEPENHLAPGRLNEVLAQIETLCAGHQVFAATHSSYVLNKLGLDSLVLLGSDGALRLGEIPPDTLSYFKRLPGFDTLRVVLCNRAILVEGPSDELVVQRAFLQKFKLTPLQAGVEVISVGLAFRRFLDIAKPLGKRVAVVRDNDGHRPKDIRDRYAEYTDAKKISVHTGKLADGRTLEPQLIAAAGVQRLNRVFGTSFGSAAELEAHMSGNKTDCALKILEAEEEVPLPKYINEAVLG